MSVNDFIDSLSCSEGDQFREWFRVTADLTVKLRVGYTSQDRPDGDPFCGIRGKSIPRVGTGWIWNVGSSDVVFTEVRPCGNRDGQEVRKYWKFNVHTAQHVVYNTEEAKRTRIDLFYDDETPCKDGKVISVWPLRVDRSNTEYDWCVMECVTHDEGIGERVKSLSRRWHSLYEDIRSTQIYFKKSSLSDEGQDYTLIISHPHGQAKKITLGKQRPPVKDGDYRHGYQEYETATCPGSSGAPVFMLDTKGDDVFLRHHVFGYHGYIHSGTQSSSVSTDQINFGHFGWLYYRGREKGTERVERTCRHTERKSDRDK